MVPRPVDMRSDSNSIAARFGKTAAICALAILESCGAGAPPQSSTARQTSDLALTNGASPALDENRVLERMFVDRPAPSLDGLMSIDRERAPGWSTLRGQVVVLDFWAPWCGVCHIVAADLNRWKLRFGERLRVIGIAAGSVEHVTTYASRFHMQYSIVADPDEKVSKAFDAFAVPLLFVVDVTGVVRAVTLGYSSPRMSKMEKLVEQLLSSS